MHLPCLSHPLFPHPQVGTDKARDLAVVRVNAPSEALRPLPLSSSARPRVGQQVLAIGNPYGFDHTLTTGVKCGSGVDTGCGRRACVNMLGRKQRRWTPSSGSRSRSVLVSSRESVPVDS
eukprot:357074-Chlamydomonas_euryale.AAC.4